MQDKWLFKNRVIFFLLCCFVFCEAQGSLVLAGGGSEGEIGECEAWSYLLYQKLFTRGDRNGDGLILVGILATEFSEDLEKARWLPAYLVWIGETLGLKVVAQNYAIPSREKANDEVFLKPLQQADILFVKGGDQGEYYDFWNETLLENILRDVFQKGVIGGTSAGAMSFAEYSFSGGNDLVSADVLSDACTSYLEDISVPKTSGIHRDFLSFLSKSVIDTHYTQRGRMGRLIGILAKASQDFQQKEVVGIGLEQKTGLWIHQGVAEVIGYGEVAFIQETEKTFCIRESGLPLIYTNLRLDRLTHGHRYELVTKRPQYLKENKEVQTLDSAKNPIKIFARGSPAKIYFEFYAILEPDFQLKRNSRKSFFSPSLGFDDFENKEKRMEYQEALFYGLQQIPQGLGFLLCSGNHMVLKEGKYLGIEPDQEGRSGSAGIVVDTSTVFFQEKGVYRSNYANSQSRLRATTMFNATLHVFGNSFRQGIFLDIENRNVLRK